MDFIIPGAVPRVVRVKTPILTPDELVAECASAEPATIESALEIARLTLHEHLRELLDGFAYRSNLKAPRAVWARVTAIALERVLSAQETRENLAAQVRGIIEESNRMSREISSITAKANAETETTGA